jgi:hypothetical protein
MGADFGRIEAARTASRAWGTRREGHGAFATSSSSPLSSAVASLSCSSIAEPWRSKEHLIALRAAHCGHDAHPLDIRLNSTFVEYAAFTRLTYAIASPAHAIAREFGTTALSFCSAS